MTSICCLNFSTNSSCSNQVYQFAHPLGNQKPHLVSTCNVHSTLACHKMGSI